MLRTSLYIHIPFCNHRCGYCDFNTYANLQALIPAYTQALVKEIKILSSTMLEEIEIHTVYFGGGTPSLIPESDLGQILSTIRTDLVLLPNAEISLEANPGTVSVQYLKSIHSMGVNRLSLGMQSSNQEELILLERQHSFTDVVNSVEWAKAAGIDNINLDLIYGLPGQELDTWKKSLDAALMLQPAHLSLYALTLDQGTPMQRKIEGGSLAELNEDSAADMYELARDELSEAGYSHYEISNWALEKQPGEAPMCIHNLQYWRNLPYIGLGAGAHGYINQYRTVDILRPGMYIKRMEDGHAQLGSQEFPWTPATIRMTPIDVETEIGETMMMGLRLLDEGVGEKEFQQRFGIGLEERFASQIERLIIFGLLEWIGGEARRLRLTTRGQLLGNQVFKEFI